VADAVEKNTATTRTWTIGRSPGGQTFYVRWGDAFVAACSLLSLSALALTFVPARHAKV
jgi:hypothetical protein